MYKPVEQESLLIDQEILQQITYRIYDLLEQSIKQAVSQAIDEHVVMASLVIKDKVSLRRRKITDYLQGRDWVLRSEIQRAALGGSVAVKEMDVVLQAMLADGHLSQKEEFRDGGVKTTKKLYKLKELS